MKILFIILLIFCFSNSKAQSNKEVVNDTLWTIELNTFSGGFTVSKEHNLFYTINSYISNPDSLSSIASHNLENGEELVRKYYGQYHISAIFNEIEDKVMINVRDSLFFLDPITLEEISKVKLPSYQYNGEDISDYKFLLYNTDIFFADKYLKISPKDEETNRVNASFIYDIANNKFIKSFNNEFKSFFNEDESLFIQCYENGFDIFNTNDWSIEYNYTTEYKYFEDELKYRYSKYLINDVSFNLDNSKIALSVYNESKEEKLRIEIFNVNQNNFEESFQIMYLDGLENANREANIHFIDNENIIIYRRNIKYVKPETFIYKLNTNGFLIEYPQQNIRAGRFINLKNNDILCNDFYNFYARINVSPELLTSVNENREETTSIFPNPTNDIINIDTESTTNIELFDIFGNKLLEDYNTKLNISHLSPGTYYIRYLGQTKMVVKI